MSCGVGGRCGSDLALLWLWCRLAAITIIKPLALELPYAMGAALKRQKTKKRKKKETEMPVYRWTAKCLFIPSIIQFT